MPAIAAIAAVGIAALAVAVGIVAAVVYLYGEMLTWLVRFIGWIIDPIVGEGSAASMMAYFRNWFDHPDLAAVVDAANKFDFFYPWKACVGMTFFYFAVVFAIRIARYILSLKIAGFGAG